MYTPQENIQNAKGKKRFWFDLHFSLYLFCSPYPYLSSLFSILFLSVFQLPYLTPSFISPFSWPPLFYFSFPTSQYNPEPSISSVQSIRHFLFLFILLINSSIDSFPLLPSPIHSFPLLPSLSILFPYSLIHYFPLLHYPPFFSTSLSTLLLYTFMHSSPLLLYPFAKFTPLSVRLVYSSIHPSPLLLYPLFSSFHPSPLFTLLLATHVSILLLYSSIHPSPLL